MTFRGPAIAAAVVIAVAGRSAGSAARGSPPAGAVPSPSAAAQQPQAVDVASLPQPTCWKDNRRGVASEV
jgi:hypothetical protein